MLRKLHVRNYVLIDSLDIEFPEGLVIVTGQTGAGKSIIIGALSMVLGAKADASVIGASADNCIVEAEFFLGDDNYPARRFVEENDAEWDGGNILIRRVISRSGRSRNFLNDSPISLSSLAGFAPGLIDIHSQHQTMMLSDRKFRLSALDSYAGNASLLEQCHSAWRKYSETEHELKTLSADIEKAVAERDYNEARYRQLEAARLEDGELERLEEEQKYLSNAEDIKEHLCAAESFYSGGAREDSGYCASEALKEAQKHIEKIAGFIPGGSELSARIESSRLELEDIFTEISGINSMAEASPERLAEVEDRISLLYGLMNRHSCNTVGELIALRDSLALSESLSADMEERKVALEKELSESASLLASVSASLHESRLRAAPALAEAIMEKLHFLELPYAAFVVEVLDAPLSASGADSVSFLFSASGKNLSDVSKCASGGELSRIMLSIKAVMARYFDMPAMIFDEIDTGVSGSTADRMGTMICEMGRYMQVFAITHLPQVAAKGSAHYLVSKTIDPLDSHAETTIKKLSDEQRVMEVARMLSASSLTDAAIANAKELLRKS